MTHSGSDVAEPLRGALQRLVAATDQFADRANIANGLALDRALKAARAALEASAPAPAPEPALDVAARRMLRAVEGLTGSVTGREELDGATTELRAALTSEPSR